MSSSVSSSIDAYGKAFLHAFKFPSQPVSGLLLGKRAQEDGGSLFISDAVPLFHTSALSCPNAMLDVALAQCHAVAKTRGLQLVGVYVANELATDNSVSAATSKTVAYIIDKFNLASLVTWQLLNTHLHPGATSPAAAQFVYQSSGVSNSVPLRFARWNTGTCGLDAETSDTALAKVREALEAFAHTKLADFDMHLENPQVDYFNEKLSL